MNKKVPAGNYKKAIEVLEIVADKFNVKFTIHYSSRKYQYRSNVGWIIKTMGKTFCSVDSFVMAAAKAVEFIYNAHEQNKK